MRGAGLGRGLKTSARHAAPKALAGLSRCKGSNEEAYLFRSWSAPALAATTTDHCTRLCHASSVAALLEGVGSGAVSNR